MDMRQGWSELSKWTSSIRKLEEFLLSSDDSEFENFVVRDKELNSRWTSLTRLVDQREVS